GSGKIAPNQQFNPRYPPKATAVLVRPNLISLRFHTIFGSARELGLFAEYRLKDGTRVCNGQANPKRHEKWKEWQRPCPGLGIEFSLRYQIETRDRKCRSKK